MNKAEFLGQLERLLYDIPQQEREEALDFYRSYFEDAGEENEAQVIQELGSPGKVAAIIKADLNETKEEHGEYTESGYQDERFREENMPEKAGSSYRETENSREEKAKNSQGPYSGYRYTGKEHKRAKCGISWPLLIVIGILALPLLLGLGGGAVGLLIGLVFGILGILAGLFFGGIGCLIAGIAGLVHTLIYQLANPATAMAAAGGCLILVAIGIVCSLGFVWLAFKAFPALFRWVVDTIQKFMHNGSQGGGKI